MQLLTEQKEQIKIMFDRMEHTGDLIVLINHIQSLAFEAGNQAQSGKQRLIKLQTLTYLANTKLPTTRYKSFSIPKKNGGERTLHAPIGVLKTVQRCLNIALQVLAEDTIHRAATGFVPGKSIVDNARPHVGKPYIYNLDLKDFFPSISFGRVKACLMLPPFNFVEKRESLAFIIANLCCERNADNPKHSFLPQGAPTSPILTNIICQQLDRRLNGLAKRFKLTYTRYADDLTFSSYSNVYKPDSEFNRELNRIITDQGFIINPAKTRLQQTGYRQEVTGLIVNERVNVSRAYCQEIRFLLHLWEKHGEATAEERYWLKHHPQTPATKRPTLRNVLMGKLLYMRMVRGQSDMLYKNYQNCYARLTGQEPIDNQTAKVIKSEPFGIQEAEMLIRIIELYKIGDIARATEEMDVYEARFKKP